MPGFMPFTKSSCKTKGLWEENIFVLRAVVRNTDNLQIETDICEGKILQDKNVFIESCRKWCRLLKRFIEGWKKTLLQGSSLMCN